MKSKKIITFVAALTALSIVTGGAAFAAQLNAEDDQAAETVAVEEVGETAETAEETEDAEESEADETADETEGEVDEIIQGDSLRRYLIRIFTRSFSYGECEGVGSMTSITRQCADDDIVGSIFQQGYCRCRTRHTCCYYLIPILLYRIFEYVIIM